MSQALAENIRALRERCCWTQEQLAEAAQVNLRTVQRAEAAQGASAETLLALAGAFNVDVEFLRFDTKAFLARELGVSRDELTPELLAQKKKEIDAQYATVMLSRITASADLRAISDSLSMYFDCTSKEDDVLDVAAALQQDLIDLIDIGRDIDATHRRRFEFDVFEHVKRLKKLDAVVTIGLHYHRLKPAGQDSVPWTTLYVIVAPEREARTILMIPRNRRIRLV
jgi:transcriptional regulator with XRE-family HTH domain